jgi:hypothetical protein
MMAGRNPSNTAKSILLSMEFSKIVVYTLAVYPTIMKIR